MKLDKYAKIRRDRYIAAQLQDGLELPPAESVVICVDPGAGSLMGVVGEIVQLEGALRVVPLVKVGSFTHYLLYGSEVEVVWPAGE